MTEIKDEFRYQLTTWQRTKNKLQFAIELLKKYNEPYVIREEIRCLLNAGPSMCFAIFTRGEYSEVVN